MNGKHANGVGADNEPSTPGDYTHPLSKVLPTRPLGPMRSPARALGWFSIGLGLAEMAMPRKLARVAGAPNLPSVVRAYGMREIAVGVGLLTSKDPSPWLWARVAGDTLDIATVGAGMLVARRPLRSLSTVAMLLGIAYVDAKVAEAAPPGRKRARSSVYDYSDRSGFPLAASQMRGVGTKPSVKMNGADGASGNGGLHTRGSTQGTAASPSMMQADGR